MSGNPGVCWEQPVDRSWRRRSRMVMVAASAALALVAGCGQHDDRVATAPGEAPTTTVASEPGPQSHDPKPSAQDCQDAIGSLPAVAMFDRTPPTSIVDAVDGAAGWIDGLVTVVRPGRARPHDLTVEIDGETRSPDLRIAHANLVVQVIGSSPGLATGESVELEIPVAYVPAERLRQVDAHVDALTSACAGVAVTAFVRQGGSDGSSERAVFGLTRLAGAVVEGADGIRSLDPLVPGDRPLDMESRSEFTQT